MKTLNLNFWGKSSIWWVVLLVGILLMISGFAYWIWPFAGYAVASQLFGWMLLVAGVVELCVAGDAKHAPGWGWWLAGGIINIFIGFMLIRSVILSELLFPFFISIIFQFWGISTIVSAVNRRNYRYWWLHLINGILLIIVGLLLLEAGWLQNIIMTTLLTSLAFIYWGFTITMISYDLLPTHHNT